MLTTFKSLRENTYMSKENMENLSKCWVIHQVDCAIIYRKILSSFLYGAFHYKKLRGNTEWTVLIGFYSTHLVFF